MLRDAGELRDQAGVAGVADLGRSDTSLQGAGGVVDRPFNDVPKFCPSLAWVKIGGGSGEVGEVGECHATRLEPERRPPRALLTARVTTSRW
jgi:hypothetical protein